MTELGQGVEVRARYPTLARMNHSKPFFSDWILGNPRLQGEIENTTFSHHPNTPFSKKKPFRL